MQSLTVRQTLRQTLESKTQSETELEKHSFYFLPTRMANNYWKKKFPTALMNNINYKKINFKSEF